ncbi:TPA: hypothetical protein ACKPZZ_000156 [Stenotrophomonas maltophilia]
MKIEIKLGLNQPSITFLFFSGFLLGVVITGVALLGSQMPLKCFEAGNAADWAAAAGTWVIGYGAWKYAAVAHKQRIHEYRQSELRRIKDASVRAAAMVDNTAWINTIGGGLERISVGDPDGGAADASSTCRVSLALLETLSWRSEDLTLLPEGGVSAHSALNRLIARMKDTMQRSLPMLDASSTVTAGVIASLISLGTEARKIADAFADYVNIAVAGLALERQRLNKALSDEVR